MSIDINLLLMMNDPKNKIEKKFEKRGFRRGGVLFLTPDVAIEMVRRCREQKVPILGLDAFKLSEGRTQPVMEESVDYTSRSDPASETDDRWSHAEAFLLARASRGFYFEVVSG